jgi:hypothetical protein
MSGQLRAWILASALISLAGVLLAPCVRAEGDASAAPPSAAPTQPLPTAAEARAQAELLHESVHATLHAIHRQYFHNDEKDAIPATTLKSVFRELTRRRKVELRWLAVNAQAMNVDHEAKTPFEKAAVEALAAGGESFERIDDSVYRRVAAVTLSSECLKCHLPTRSDTRDRLAGLLIALPVRGD